MTVALLALVLFTTASARADVIPADYEPPACAPMSCPAGSMAGSSGHGCPSACVPWHQTCTSSAECGGPGWICMPTRFCLAPRPTGRMIEDVVVGECAADGSCPEGTCTEASRCAPDPAYVAPPAPSPATPTAAPAPSGGLCSVGFGRGPAVGLVLALVPLLARRRR